MFDEFRSTSVADSARGLQLHRKSHGPDLDKEGTISEKMLG